ncbi:hypothetical protein CYMTET_16843 [Cymbomonas tetramitiformis]|uniref:Uncharacterized protein n=1 Tax=Cymbomonas tetramitiformis TaxID=36881 RepID=A0AAE0GBD8_9CHLO|nr:hypothetical protein CYMTET_16843 [Cymbomonas tetramitiformis]
MTSVYDLRSGKRRLFVDKDIRLSDTVRNSPTTATPPQPLPQPPQDQEPAGLTEIRAKFFELNDCVAQLYDDDKDKAIAKDVRSDVLGGKHVRFRAKDSDKGRIGDLIRRLKREFEKARLGVDVFDFNDQHVRVHPAVNQFLYDVVSLVVEPSSLAALKCFEHYMALRYPAEVDPRPLLEEEHRLVAENDTEDWTPTTDSRRRNMYLVPEALAAVPLPTLVFEIVEVYLAWEDQEGDGVESPHPASMRYSGADRAGGHGDDIDGRIRQLVQQNVVANKRIADLEALVHGRVEGMSKPTTKRPGGFRPGFRDPGRRVAFDPKDKKAKPPCPRCGRGACADQAREVKTLALCKMFDDAAEQGPRAFESCTLRFGEPALLEGERVLPDSQRDISAFGFAVGGDALQAHWEGGSSDDEDAEADLSFQQVSHLPAAPQTSSDMPQGHAGGKISITHAQLGQPGQPQTVVRPADGAAGGAAAAGGAFVRWRDRRAVGPLSEADEEFEATLAADRTAYASGEVVASAPAVGGRACGIGHSALAAYYPKWLLVATMLLCITAVVGALQVPGGARAGGALPAGLSSGMPLERDRVPLVADGAQIYPNPPSYDGLPQPPLDDRVRGPVSIAGAGPLLEAQDWQTVHAGLGHLELRGAMRRLGLAVRPGGGLSHDPTLEDAQRSHAAGGVAAEDDCGDEDAAAAGAEPVDTDI